MPDETIVAGAVVGKDNAGKPLDVTNTVQDSGNVPDAQSGVTPKTAAAMSGAEAPDAEAVKVAKQPELAPTKASGKVADRSTVNAEAVDAGFPALRITCGSCGEWHYGDVVSAVDVERVFLTRGNIARLIRQGAVQIHDNPKAKTVSQLNPDTSGEESFPDDVDLSTVSGPGTYYTPPPALKKARPGGEENEG